MDNNNEKSILVFNLMTKYWDLFIDYIDNKTSQIEIKDKTLWGVRQLNDALPWMDFFSAYYEKKGLGIPRHDFLEGKSEREFLNFVYEYNHKSWAARLIAYKLVSYKTEFWEIDRKQAVILFTPFAKALRDNHVTGDDLFEIRDYLLMEMTDELYSNIINHTANDKDNLFIQFLNKIYSTTPKYVNFDYTKGLPVSILDGLVEFVGLLAIDSDYEDIRREYNLYKKKVVKSISPTERYRSVNIWPFEKMKKYVRDRHINLNVYDN